MQPGAEDDSELSALREQLRETRAERVRLQRVLAGRATGRNFKHARSADLGCKVVFPRCNRWPADKMAPMQHVTLGLDAIHMVRRRAVREPERTVTQAAFEDWPNRRAEVYQYGRRSGS
jgi:hypothetical protein